MAENKRYTEEELEKMPEEQFRKVEEELKEEVNSKMESQAEAINAKMKSLAPVVQILQSCPELRQKIQRNDKCPCGSGLKYKHCCIRFESENLSRDEAFMKIKELGFVPGPIGR